MKPGKVFAIIMGERTYQDAQLEKGRFQQRVHTVGEELLLMKRYLDKAIAKYADNFGDAPALHGIRKVAALAVRCMENHGALPRENEKTLFENCSTCVGCKSYSWYKEMNEPHCGKGRPITKGMKECVVFEEKEEDEVPF